MKFDPQKHHRRSIRSKEYDYAQPGGYFVTMVAYQRECWCAISGHFANVELGAHAVMPNHVHGIIIINGCCENRAATNSAPPVGARHASPLRHPSNPRGYKSRSIAAIVASFKSTVTRTLGRKFGLGKIWQRNYYEHIIRDNDDWNRIHRYIASNLSMWAADDKNPASIH